MKHTTTAVALALAVSFNASAAAPNHYECVLLPGSAQGAQFLDDQGRLGGTSLVPGDSEATASFWPQPGRAPQHRATPADYEWGLVEISGMNNRGALIGTVRAGIQHPTLWDWPKKGGSTLLPLLPVPYAGGDGVALNDKGHAVGFNNTAAEVNHAVLWKDGKVMDLGALDTWQPARKAWSMALGVNNSDDVVGYAQGKGDEFRAVLWPKGRKSGLVDLSADQWADGTFARANAINNNGLIVGSTNKHYAEVNEFLAVAWSERKMVRLKGLTDDDYSGAALRVNDQGVMAGWSQPVSSGPALDVVWYALDAKPVDPNALLDARGCQDAAGNRYAVESISDLNNLGEMLATGKVAGLNLRARFRLLPR